LKLFFIMYVIKNNFKRLSAPLSKLYAILIVFLSLTMGSTLQFRSAVECIDESNKQAIYIFSAIFIIFVLIAILGGTDRITRACKYAIPLASILYIVMALSVIIINASGIPRLIVSIFKSAFNFRAATGGVSAFLFSKALSEGFSRGLLSNEAGAGTSGIAHSRNTSASPATVGLFGICEVFADTVILCPLTAFAILLSLDSSSITKSGAETVKNALSTLGAISSPLLFACIALFAYSTVICWFYYGRVALGYLKVGHTGLFTLIFLLSLVCGTIIETGYLIYASDAILFSLCVISLFAISKSSDRLIALSEADGLL